MKISARTRYGLRILLDLATNGADGAPRPISVIAKSQMITAAFISRLAVPLKRAGLVEAYRGVTGGLRLALPPEKITLLAITEALDGPISILKCLSPKKPCNRKPQCPSHLVWKDLNATIKAAFESVTLDKVMKRLCHEELPESCCI